MYCVCMCVSAVSACSATRLCVPRPSMSSPMSPSSWAVFSWRWRYPSLQMAHSSAQFRSTHISIATYYIVYSYNYSLCVFSYRKLSYLLIWWLSSTSLSKCFSRYNIHTCIYTYTYKCKCSTDRYVNRHYTVHGSICTIMCVSFTTKLRESLQLIPRWRL